jgi:hypothetical protein
MKTIIYSQHAIEKMEAEDIREVDVENAIYHGNVIENYPNAFPYPARLLLWRSHGRPLHVVAAEQDGSYMVIVVTTYIPKLEKWNNGFKERK